MTLPLVRRSARALEHPDRPGPGGLALFGVPVRFDVSCAFALALGTWTFADTILPAAADGQPALAYWTAGGLSALVLLASIAVHEAAHCVAARRVGVDVDGVELALFGGVTRLARAPSTARAELRIALAGPLASLGLAVAATIAHVAIVELGGDGLGATVAAIIAVGNLAIAALNLVPAPPLDGGLLLRAVLRRLPLHRVDGERLASGTGHVLGVVLIALSVVGSASGDAVVGLWGGLLGLVICQHSR